VITDFGGHLQKHVVGAALAARINSGNWKDVTVAQLASAGIFPGMGNSAAGTATAVAKAPARAAVTAMTASAAPAIITPDTGSGCNYNSAAGSMCIYVYGTGLKVTEWDSSVANPTQIDTCTYAGYWVNNKLLTTSNETCGDSSFWAFDTGTVTWPNQTQLCNTWIGFPGKPCLVVHT
jgi:hypothetical protein